MAPSSYFYPRPPRGGRRPLEINAYKISDISIHALREEGDTHSAYTLILVYKFLSTPSARRATLDQFLDGIHISISIHALREEGDDTTYMTGKEAVEFLSTPSARRATRLKPRASGRGMISIHALREEGDSVHRCSISGHIYFYPRPPRGGRRVC